MRIKLSVVCLLALAGTAGIFFAARFGPRDPARPQCPAQVLPQRRIQNNASRSVAVRDLRLQRDSTKVHGVADSQTVSPTPGVAKFSIPVTFEPNVGQADNNVQFVGRGKGLTVLLTRQEIAVRVATPATAQNGTLVLRVAGNAGFDWKGDAKVRAQSNYFVGNDPKKWHTSVPHFARAETADAAPGVGMAIYGNDEGVEYDLRVAPGGNVSKLRLTLTGAENLRVIRLW